MNRADSGRFKNTESASETDEVTPMSKIRALLLFVAVCGSFLSCAILVSCSGGGDAPYGQGDRNEGEDFFDLPAPDGAAQDAEPSPESAPESVTTETQL